MKKPEIKPEINLDELKVECQEYIDAIEQDEHADKLSDLEHHIFESAIQAIYGEKVWDWINSKLD